MTGTVGDRDLVVRIPKLAPDSNVVYLLLHPRSGNGDTYYYRGQCDASETEWVCQEQVNQFAPPPADEQGYDVIVVKNVGKPSRQADKLLVVPTPTDESGVIYSVPVAS
jgi:hypothetical protein